MKKSHIAVFSSTVFVVIFVLAFSLVSIFSEKRAPGPPDTPGFYQPASLPGLVHEHVPGMEGLLNGVSVRINSLGLRGPEVIVPKPMGVVRVVVFGDSIVFGQGVLEEQTLSVQLENMLKDQAPGIKWETINAGVRGYNMTDYVIVFEPRIMAFEPDILVLVITEINDPERRHFVPRSEKIERWKDSWWSGLPFVKPFMAFPLAKEINRLFIEHVGKIYAPEGEDWPLFVRDLEAIAGRCQEDEVLLTVVTFPLLVDEDLLILERKQLQNTLTEMSINWVDPWPRLRRLPARELVVSKGDFHPNGKALSLTAELLAEPIAGIISGPVE